jgi:hypothetical protein
MRDYLPLFGLGMWVATMMSIYAIFGWLARREQRREREAALTAAPESHPKSSE